MQFLLNTWFLKIYNQPKMMTEKLLINHTYWFSWSGYTGKLPQIQI